MNWPKVDEREARFEQRLTDSRLSDFNNNIPRQGSRGGKKYSRKFPSNTSSNSTERKRNKFAT